MPPSAPLPSIPLSSVVVADQDDLRITIYEMQHVQRFHTAELSWMCHSLQMLCQAQNIPLPPYPELHDFHTDEGTSTADTEPLLDDQDEDVDVTSMDPADDDS